MKFTTRQIHAGVEPDPLTGSILTPIYQSTTFVQESVDKYLDKGFSYSRTNNPTVKQLEEKWGVSAAAPVAVAAGRGPTLVPERDDILCRRIRASVGAGHAERAREAPVRQLRIVARAPDVGQSNRVEPAARNLAVDSPQESLGVRRSGPESVGTGPVRDN